MFNRKEYDAVEVLEEKILPLMKLTSLRLEISYEINTTEHVIFCAQY